MRRTTWIIYFTAFIRLLQLKATEAEMPLLANLLKVEPGIYIVVVLIRRFKNTIRHHNLQCLRMNQQDIYRCNRVNLIEIR